MKSLIVYASIHHQNKEKVATVIAAELEANLLSVFQAHPDALATYDLIGFGSGIYGRKFHKTLIQFVEAVPSVTQKRASVFTTSGAGATAVHGSFKELLANRGFSVVGDFSCKGRVTWGPYRLIGGINKGRPNDQDLEDARTFARGLKQEYA